MAGVGDEYDNRRNNGYGGLPSRDNNVGAYSDPGSAWGGQQFDPASHQQQQQQLQQQQQWYGYYPEQQVDDRGQDGMAAPPLPSMPPPQAPLPPGLATTAAWTVSEQGAANGGSDPFAAAAAAAYSYAQQQVQEYGGYGGGTSYGNPNPVASSGSYPPVPGYAGYNYAVDPNAYNYQGYQGYPNPEENSYGQNSAVYSNAVAPYGAPAQYPQPSVPADAGSYGTSGNYYDPTAYQSGGYRHPGDGEQAQNSWSHPTQGNYSYGGGYANAGYGGANAKADEIVQYGGPDYSQQWAEYYASMEAARQSGNGESNGGAQVAATAAAHVAAPTYASVLGAPSAQQPSPPGTAAPSVSWPDAATSQQGYGESQLSEVASVPEGPNAGPVWSGGGNEGSRSDHLNQGYFPPLPTQTRPGPAPLEDQPLEFSRIHAGYSVQQHQLQQQQQQQQQQQHPQQHPQQKLQQQLPSKAAKMHIVTNPRITGNAGGVGAGKETAKPAYLSVGAKNAGIVRGGADAAADAALQPGMFPSSLRAYVERALSRCKEESQKAACQAIMKDMITSASVDGTLFTKDWDTEPLFAVPPASSLLGSGTKKETSRPESILGKGDWHLSRPAKTRWGAPSTGGPDEKGGRGPSLVGSGRDGGPDASKEKNSVQSLSKWEKRDESWKNSASTPASVDMKNMSRRGQKRLRKVGLNLKWGETNGSSESEEEQALHLGSVSTADTPEEKERRQNRFRRFDRGKEHSGRGGKHSGRGRGAASAATAGSASARRATALQLALSSGEGQNGRAVEDIDWDSLTIRGTCQEVEKRYLRLTSAPDPGTVRPEDVLRRALEMVKSTTKSYLFKCEQLKSIRQDLTVQRIRDEFTVEVYETHARMALEAGDLPEYNQCQTQLKSLYGEGIRGCNNEFAAYSLLYILFNRGNSRDLVSAMGRLTSEGRLDEVVKHALAVRHALAMGNYTSFFRLYRRAPVLSPCLMDMHVEKMRFEAVKCMTRSYRPTIPVSSVAQALGFSTEPNSEVEADGVEECEEWLRGHGAHVQVDSASGELVVEAKLSSTSLFMPEPEDVIPHGDANLALNDFFSRS